jgi:hypothetical protein
VLVRVQRVVRWATQDQPAEEQDAQDDEEDPAHARIHVDDVIGDTLRPQESF